MSSGKFIAVSSMPEDLDTWLAEYAEHTYGRKGLKSHLIIGICKNFRNKHENEMSQPGL